MRGSQAVWCLGTFSYHPYIILHFGFDYENETRFYVLVVFYFIFTPSDNIDNPREWQYTGGDGNRNQKFFTYSAFQTPM